MLVELTVSDGTQCRFISLEEDTSQGLNCGMYDVLGKTVTNGERTPNVTVQVAGLYDITHMLNACSA